MVGRKKGPFGAGRMSLNQASDSGCEEENPGSHSPTINVTSTDGLLVPSARRAPASPNASPQRSPHRCGSRRLSFQRAVVGDDMSDVGSADGNGDGAELPDGMTEEMFGKRVSSFFCGQPPSGMRRASSILKQDGAQKGPIPSQKKRVTFCGGAGGGESSGANFSSFASGDSPSADVPDFDVGAQFVTLSVEQEENLLHSPHSPNDFGRSAQRASVSSRRSSGNLRVTSNLGDYAMSQGTCSSSDTADSPLHSYRAPAPAPQASGRGKVGFGGRRIANFANPEAPVSAESSPQAPPAPGPSGGAAGSPVRSPVKRPPRSPGCKNTGSNSPSVSPMSPIDQRMTSLRKFGSRRLCTGAAQAQARATIQRAMADPQCFGDVVQSPDASPRTDTDLSPSNASPLQAADVAAGIARMGSRRVKSFRTMRAGPSITTPCRLPTQDVLEAVKGGSESFEYRDLREERGVQPPTPPAARDLTSEWVAEQDMLNDTVQTVDSELSVGTDAITRRRSARDAISHRNAEWNGDIPDELSCDTESEPSLPGSPEKLALPGGRPLPLVPPLAMEAAHAARRLPMDLAQTNSYMLDLAKNEQGKYVYRDMRVQAAMSDALKLSDEGLSRSKSVVDMIAAQKEAMVPPQEGEPLPEEDRPSDARLATVKSGTGFVYRDMRKSVDAAAEGTPELTRGKSALDVLAARGAAEHAAEGRGDAPVRGAPTSGMLQRLKSGAGEAPPMRDMRHAAGDGDGQLSRRKSTLDVLAERALRDAENTPPTRRASSRRLSSHCVGGSADAPAPVPQPQPQPQAPEDDRTTPHMLEAVKSGRGFSYRDMRSPTTPQAPQGLQRKASAIEMLADAATAEKDDDGGDAGKADGNVPTRHMLDALKGQAYEVRDMRAHPLEGTMHRMTSAVDLIAARNVDANRDIATGTPPPETTLARAPVPAKRVAGVSSPILPPTDTAPPEVDKPSAHMLAAVRSAKGFTYRDMRSSPKDDPAEGDLGRVPSATNMLAELAQGQQAPPPTSGMLPSVRSQRGAFEYRDMRLSASPDGKATVRRDSAVDLIANAANAHGDVDSPGRRSPGQGPRGRMGLPSSTSELALPSPQVLPTDAAPRPPPTAGMLATVKSGRGAGFNDRRGGGDEDPLSRRKSALDVLAEAAMAEDPPPPPPQKKKRSKPSPIVTAVSPETSPLRQNSLSRGDAPGPHVPVDNIAVVKAAGVAGRDMRAGGGSSALDAMLRQQGYDPDTLGDGSPSAPAPAPAHTRPSEHMLATVKSGTGFAYRDMRKSVDESGIGESNVLGESALQREPSALDMLAARAAVDLGLDDVVPQGVCGSPSARGGVVRAKRRSSPEGREGSPRGPPTSGMLQSVKSASGFEYRDMRAGDQSAPSAPMERKRSAIDMLAERALAEHTEGPSTPPVPAPSSPSAVSAIGRRRSSLRRFSMRKGDGVSSAPHPGPPPPPELGKPSGHMLDMVKSDGSFAYRDAREGEGGLQRRKSALDVLAERAMADLEGTGVTPSAPMTGSSPLGRRRSSLRRFCGNSAAQSDASVSDPSSASPPPELGKPSGHMLDMVKSDGSFAYRDAREGEGGLQRRKSALDVLAERAMADMEGSTGASSTP
eukprot:TRINITY_DN13238_c0_g1_i1.p1 TRINITY_DN13238_c0_g1~~TRINITY_DN13238_c0_g1_i1.p1  ORF type:complete len:1646 (+),score=342.07 TRINITY_DN13238_c0_g1_i1:115-4938(+)